MKCHEGSSCFEEHTASLIYGHSTSVCVPSVCLISPWRLSTWRFHRVKTCYILKMSSFLLQHFVYASARSSHTEFNLGLLLCVHIYTWIGVWYIYVHVVHAKNSSTVGEKINVTHSRKIISQNWIKVKSMLINRLNPELSRANKTKKATKKTKKHFRAFYFLSEYTSVHTQRHSADKNTTPCLPCGELSLIFFLHSKMHCAVITRKKNNPLAIF